MSATDHEHELHQLLEHTLRAYLQQLAEGRNPICVAKPDAVPDDPKWKHHHMSPEMFFQIDGSTIFNFPNQRIEVGPGQAIIIPRHLAHIETMLDGEKPFRNIVMIALNQRVSYHLTYKDSEEKSRIVCYGHIRSPRADTITACMDELALAHFGNAQNQEQSIQGFSYSLLSLFIDLLHERDHQPIPINEKVESCLEHIDRNVGNHLLTVQVLAQWLECHPDYLSKLFKQEKGQGLNAYINSKRIALAKDILHSSDIPISQIAFTSGYQDPAYFARIFKKHVGCTPQQFRLK